MNPDGPFPTRRSRRWRAATWLALALAGGLLSSVAAVPKSAAQREPERPLACTSRATMVAEPAIVQAGGEVTVTAHASALCDAPDVHQHVVLVLDASSSMAGAPMAALSETVRSFVRTAELGPTRRLGIATFADSGKILCRLTADAAVLEACVDRLAVDPSVGGGSSISAGIQTGMRVMIEGRRDFVTLPDDIREVLLVLSDGSDNAGCDAVQRAAEQAKAQGMLVVTVCVGSGCDASCMRSAASSPRYHLVADGPSDLARAFDELATILERISQEIKRSSLEVRLVPGPGMEVVDGSQSPGAPELHANGLGWAFDRPSSDGVTATFRVRPLVAGDLPVLASAEVTYGIPGEVLAQFAFDVPRVAVGSGGVLPTATPQAAAPLTATVHSLSASPRQPAPGERQRLRYRLSFQEPERPVGGHVVLVGDASGSMAGASNEALRAGFVRLVALLPTDGEPPTRMGVAIFNTAAKILARLTSEPEVLRTAIGTIGAAGGSCVECGLLAGRRILELDRPAAGGEDIVLVADGPNNAGCPSLLAIADTVKAEGIAIHAVCLLPDCDTQCLAAAATPGRYHEAAGPAELGGALERVAASLAGDARVTSVDLALAVPPHMRLVEGSASIAPTGPPEAGVVRWRLDGMPAAVLELTADLEAIAAGIDAPIAVADVRLRDGSTWRGVAEALAPTPEPTPPAPPAWTIHIPAAAR